MLNGFINFLDDYLEEHGVAGLAKATLGILAFATLLSTIFGTPAIKAGALVIAILCLLSALVAVSAHLLRFRARADRHAHLLARYCQVLTDQLGPQWRITRWDEAVDIAKNGNTTGSITVYAVVEADVLRFFRIRLGCGWQQPEANQRKVRVSVASFEIEGTGRTRWEDTSYWRSDGRLEILIHCLSEAPGKGDEVRFHLDVTWPGKAKPLMRLGEPDEFTARFAQPGVQLTYRVALPPGTRAKCDAIGFPADTFTLSHFAARRSQPVVELVASDIPAHQRVGMRLDLQ